MKIESDAMSKEKIAESREERITAAKIQVKTEEMVKSMTKLTELPENFLACGTLPNSDEIFVVRIKMNKITDGKKQLHITGYDFVVDGVTNGDLMHGLDEAYGCPILFDDPVANKILGDNRAPTRVADKYKLNSGKKIDIYMPRMNVAIH